MGVSLLVVSAESKGVHFILEQIEVSLVEGWLIIMVHSNEVKKVDGSLDKEVVLSVTNEDVFMHSFSVLVD